MLFQFLQKQSNKRKQKKLIETMIFSLNISKEQKNLYLDALEVLGDKEAEQLYINLSHFIEKVEMKELEQISKENFSSISGMRKKEAEEKMEEMNSFSFLLHNL